MYIRNKYLITLQPVIIKFVEFSLTNLFVKSDFVFLDVVKFIQLKSLVAANKL